MFKKLISSAACILGLLCSSASAQETSNRVSTQTDWSVFVESDPTECWAVTAPKETVNKRDGSVVAVRRSKILLFVFHRPSDNVKGQVAFTGGYPFAKGRSIALDLDGVTYDLAADGEWAWPPSAADDAKIIAAMKRGAKAVVTAQSERGTVTKDTFSLNGFTAAVKDAEKRCAG
ncbi:MAG: invasion protein IalB [Planktomarina sp.]|jgi:invasion protein IalB|tara:strand:+ start:1774 stop:2298 length:525 start_codon:yes stop_codon:yes gene_type:complete